MELYIRQLYYTQLDGRHMSMMNIFLMLILLSTSREIWTQDTSVDHAIAIQAPVQEEHLPLNAATKLEILDLFKKSSSASMSNGDGGVDVFRDYGVPPEVVNVPKDRLFSLFRAPHKQAMLHLMNYFENAGSIEEMVSLSRAIKPYLNDQLFQAAFTNVLMNMEIDTELPRISEARPENFVNNIAIKITEHTDQLQEPQPDLFVRFRRGANATEVLMNLHHDGNGKTTSTSKKNVESKKKKRQVDQNTVTVQTSADGQYLVTQLLDLTGTDPLPENRVAYFREDYGMNSHHYNWHLIMTNTAAIPRRDEYFIYMHSQMLKRYNIERMGVGIPRVVPYSDFTSPIAVGHLPNVGDTNGEYGTRFDNSRPVDFVDITLTNNYEAQLYYGISQRLVNDPEFMGLLESYHDSGHGNIADTVTNGQDNVMAVPQVSARDNVFYRWHQNLENIYEQYQAMKGASVTQEEMVYNDLQVNYLSVYTGALLNEIQTGCGYHQLDITFGLNFRGQRARVNMIHLDHKDYNNHITVFNNANELRYGVVRLFIAPQYNEWGAVMGIEEQRRYWIEMDKFAYQFQPGDNHIIRNAQASSVAVDCRDTFDDIAERAFAGTGVSHAGHCGCGWPQHLLVPRGTSQGMSFNIFVIITNEPNAQDWRMARSTFCGLPNRELSDRRPMGFPFHAAAPANYASVQDLANGLPNAYVNEITIRYTGAPTHPEEDPVEGCGQF